MSMKPENHGVFFYNIRQFGALGDGLTSDTAAIQAALDGCAAKGGGTVFVPAGTFHCGSLRFYDNITFFLDAGAVILGSERLEDYPLSQNRWEGVEQLTYSPLFSGRQLKNISIIGRGTIDGCGKIWWERFNQQNLDYPRPRLIGFSDCENLLIEGVTLINSPSWTVNPVRCRNVNLHGLTIINPPDSPNTDGINPDSCSHVHISDCFVSVGDDCITLKSGTESEESRLRLACQDITITNCTLENGHGGVVIGSEMSGDVRHVTISNCVFSGTDRGIRFKSRRGRGGVVEDIRVSNLIMNRVLCPFTMNLYYGCGAWGDPLVSDKAPHELDEGTPTLRDIHFSQITAKEVKIAAGFIYGLAEKPVQNISFDQVSITMAEETEAGYPEMADGLELMAQAGFFVTNAEFLRFDRVEIRGQKGPAFWIDQSRRIKINDCGLGLNGEEKPFIHLNNVQDVYLSACRPPIKTQNLVKLSGELNADIQIENSAAKPLLGENNNA